MLVGTQGTFTVETVIDGTIQSVAVEKGDVLRVNNSLHRLVNDSGQAAEFLVFRFIGSGIDRSNQIKADKTTYSNEQIAGLIEQKSCDKKNEH